MTPSEVRSQNSPFFVNPAVDFLLIGGGSILFFVLCAWVFKLNVAALYSVAFALNWLCNHPHFSATHLRLYSHKQNHSQFPLTAWAIPTLILAAVIASLMSPEKLAPAFVKLYLLWSPYHYAGQVLGITLIYFARTGETLSRVERTLWVLLCFAIFVTSTVGGETAMNDRSFYGIRYPSLGLPYLFYTVSQWVMNLLGVAVLGFWIKRRMVQKRLSFISLVPVISFYIWFISGSRYAEFTLFVPFFHSAQYLLVAWSVQIAERSAHDTPREAKPFASWLRIESAKWYALNILGGIALFYLFPRIGSWSGSPLSIAEPVIISGIQLHHFFVDGVIWKLKGEHSVNLVRCSLEDSRLSWKGVA